MKHMRSWYRRTNNELEFVACAVPALQAISNHGRFWSIAKERDSSLTTTNDYHDETPFVLCYWSLSREEEREREREIDGMGRIFVENSSTAINLTRI